MTITTQAVSQTSAWRSTLEQHRNQASLIMLDKIHNIQDHVDHSHLKTKTPHRLFLFAGYTFLERTTGWDLGCPNCTWLHLQVAWTSFMLFKMIFQISYIACYCGATKTRYQGPLIDRTCRDPVLEFSIWHFWNPGPRFWCYRDHWYYLFFASGQSAG